MKIKLNGKEQDMQIRDKQNETLLKLAKAIGSIAAAKSITEGDLEMGVVGSGNIPKFLLKNQVEMKRTSMA